ncbi:OmpW/AlkL family protein [Mesorhizobium sp. J8]|uniref:OmpW/AlkL family protein n=1 Tax=Mesorhizobium sp. J8 TaxID=2777475 RepID=UPI0019151DCC|nr:OmpW family protein [Mesorhizobium sp. J8]
MTNVRLVAAQGATALMVLMGVSPEALAADPVQPYIAQDQETLEAPSPWQIRMRALGVKTNDSGYVGGIAGSNLSYSDTITPEFDISYFFTENIAAELILATTSAKVDGTGAIGPLGNVGKVWVLPPTLTLQYHITRFGAFRPYVGAGLNYTVFYNQSVGSADALHVKNTFGAALQVGFDYMLDRHWGVNFDVKKLFLQPDFAVKVAGTDLRGKAKLDPWLIGAGLTYRF